MASRQRQAANDFTATFPRETTQEWSHMVKEWETNPSRPNPYISKEHGRFFLNSSWPCGSMFMFSASKVSAARLRLTEEETMDIQWGKEALNNISASVFVRMGLELEDQQYGFSFYYNFLISDSRAGIQSSPHLLERWARTPRRRHSLNVEVRSSIKSRSGGNFRQSTCPVYSTLMWIPRNRRKPS